MAINMFLFMVECIKLILVMCGILNYKRKKKPVAALLLFAVCEALIAVKGLQEPEYRISTFYLLCTVICGLLLEGRKKYGILLLAMFGVSSLDDIVMFLAKKGFFKTELVFIENPLLYLGCSMASIVPVAIAAGLLQRYYRKREKSGVAARGVESVYIIVTVAGLFLLSTVFSFLNQQEITMSARGGWIVGISICLFSIIFLAGAILMIYNSQSKKRYKHMAELNERMLQYKEEYYEKQLKNEAETKKFRHDITNHILCLEALLREKEYEEAKKYVADILGSISELKSKYRTGNRLVNAIVNDIAGKYPEVLLEWSGSFPQETRLSNPDICVIFSNLLENAFFAANGCSKDKRVQVKVQETGSSVKLLIENSMAGPVRKKGENFITQKADRKNHGFGTKNVRERVEANDGSVEYSYTEHVFTAKIVLPDIKIE